MKVKTPNGRFFISSKVFLWYDTGMETLLEKVKDASIEKRTDLSGKRVVVRIDVNTSLGENKTVDPGEDWRIIKSYQTIDFLVQQGACVILISHIGREPDESLRPIFDYMSQHLTMGFIPRYDRDLLKNSIENMQKGSVIMLENVRQFKEEELNDSSYLEPVISLCDIYVNDAFSVSHRAHGSVADIVGHLPSYFGLQFVKEVQQLSKAIDMTNQGGSVLALGGAKFGTKFELLEKLLPRVDYALVGGALANVFLREQGFEVGKSFVDDTDISSILNNKKIILPVDVIDQNGDVALIDEVGAEDIILDIGPETEKLFETIIDHSKSILWNGPMGKYEDGYVAGSIALADSIARSGAFSVTGGGDTATVILEEDLSDNFNFISTGGGAMLEFLVQGTLPGIDAIINKN